MAKLSQTIVKLEYGHSALLPEGRMSFSALCVVMKHRLRMLADWLDEDEVDASGLTIPAPSSSALQMPVMKESEWLAKLWIEEQQF